MKSAADLCGKRVGMYDWVASGSIWYRHFLRYIDVPPDKLQWWIGDVDEPKITNHVYTLPHGVKTAPEGRALSEMLIDGELDAIYSPPRPRRYHPVNGPIVRLFPDIRAIEREYFRATGMFPPQHLIVLRREVWERDKWIARALTDAFVRCNDVFTKAQRSFPYASPWLDAELEETEELIGADFHPNGYDQTRATIEVFSRAGASCRDRRAAHQCGGILRGAFLGVVIAADRISTSPACGAAGRQSTGVPRRTGRRNALRFSAPTLQVQRSNCARASASTCSVIKWPPVTCSARHAVGALQCACRQ